MTICTCLFGKRGGLHAKLFTTISTCQIDGFIVYIDIISDCAGLFISIIGNFGGGGVAIGKVDGIISRDKVNGVAIALQVKACI